MSQINKLTLENYNRLFTFGCSMTQYEWPTWADLIGSCVETHHNYGRSGAGNQYIACAITEANLKHKFTKDDLIMIMWSSVSREDRYKDGNWQTSGNIYTSNMMSDEYVLNWADTRYYLLRDLNYIALTQGYLDNLNVDYDMLAMSKFTELQLKGRDVDFKNGADILDAYDQVVSRIKPDILSTQFKGTWPQVPIMMRGNPSPTDYHPVPQDHLSYLTKIYPAWKVPKKVRKFAEHYSNKIQEVTYTDELGWNNNVNWRI